MRNIIKISILSITISVLSLSCDSFLDELPDNRTVVDSSEKVAKLLVSAYPESYYTLVSELSSDNIDDYGASNPNTSVFYEQIAYWKESSEVDNDDLKSVWEACYKAISNANEALKAIKELGSPATLNPQKGEALLARAYNHFVLVNLFSNHYNTQTSGSDLGITYMTMPETTLSPKYERGTVAEVYQKINTDLEEGLPLIDDTLYEVPKYHFNRRAAYSFAARFNLYYENWQKAADYATIALGASPASVLRNWAALGALPRTGSVVSNSYIQAEHNANFLLLTDASNMGYVFGAYYTGSRFSHVKDIANRETLLAAGPWGATTINRYRFIPFEYSATNLDKYLYYKIPFMFQYTDLVAQIGYRRTVYSVFSADETLLIRAEANILLKKYAEAVSDLNLWARNFYTFTNNIPQADIEAFYANLPYSTADNPTQKKVLRPKFTIEAGTQENLLHYALQCRRILTIHEGFRWFDIRRYGIEVLRYQHHLDGSKTVEDILTTNDLRRTFQIPQDVILAGLTPNPR
ncbi:MAG: RagB/SusD family nutrient uptake outer membrane protein [Capnocytophaga sp.]|nr:RagB/SusD family nutrient uptake outer membrane protein [Capnocytophaga sp.]